MHRRFLATLVLLAALACAGPPPPGPSPGPSAAASAPDAPLPSPLPDILARVNGQPIVARQVVPLAKKILDEGSKEDREQRKPRAMREGLRQFIDRELLLQEAMARGVQAEDRAVQYAYDRARVEYPDEAQWVEYLSLSGFDPQSYKAEVRALETIHALLLRSAGELTVSDAEIRARYEADPGSFPPAEGKPAGLEAVREQVRTRILVEKRAHVSDGLLATLRAKARIETYI